MNKLDLADNVKGLAEKAVREVYEQGDFDIPFEMWPAKQREVEAISAIFEPAIRDLIAQAYLRCADALEPERDIVVDLTTQVQRIIRKHYADQFRKWANEGRWKVIDKEVAAHLAEITIVVLPRSGPYQAEEVNELLAGQRAIIAKRIRGEKMGKLRPRGKLTVEIVQDVLLLIGEPVPDTANSWTPGQRLQVYDWAIRTHLRASDNIIAVPATPAILRRVAPAKGGKA